MIAACLSGEAHAWDVLIARYQALIYTVCIRNGLFPEEADDVFQDVCLIMLNRLGNLRNREGLSSWLISTTVREAWRAKRQRSLTGLSDLEADESCIVLGQRIDFTTEILPEESLIRMADQQMVREALDSLGENCRSLLKLLYCEDPPTSYLEVSKRLKMAIGSIGPSRARCLQKLQNLLQQKGFF